MNYETRRSELLRILAENNDYINATQLAERFGVTRQIIVSDVALLRANGHRILATRKGYRLETNETIENMRSVVCRHRGDQVLDEFNTIVDHGASIVNVVVEHPIYGQLCADLNICSRYDAQEFVARRKETNASQLSDLTGGLHIHMLRVPSEEAFQRILNGLRNANILVEET